MVPIRRATSEIDSAVNASATSAPSSGGQAGALDQRRGWPEDKYQSSGHARDRGTPPNVLPTVPAAASPGRRAEGAKTARRSRARPNQPPEHCTQVARRSMTSTPRTETVGRARCRRRTPKADRSRRSRGLRWQFRRPRYPDRARDARAAEVLELRHDNSCARALCKRCADRTPASSPSAAMKCNPPVTESGGQSERRKTSKTPNTHPPGKRRKH